MGAAKNWMRMAKPLQVRTGLLFLSQLREIRGKKNQGKSGSEQRVGSLSRKAKGFSGMWFQRKSHSGDLLNSKLNFAVDPSGQATSSAA